MQQAKITSHKIVEYLMPFLEEEDFEKLNADPRGYGDFRVY